MPKYPLPPPGAKPAPASDPPQVGVSKAQQRVAEVQDAVERMRVTVEQARERLTRAHTQLDEIRRKLGPPPAKDKQPGSGAQ